MKRILIYGIAFLVLSYGGMIAAKHFWRGEVMSPKKVGQKWGKDIFDKQKFRNGNEKQRAKMAYSLIKNQKQFIGKNRAEIRKELGDYNGYYFSGMFPAYMIETAKSKGQDSWQVVFLLDKNEKIVEIIVHKNCCD